MSEIAERMKDLMRRERDNEKTPMDHWERMVWESGYWAGFAAREEWDSAQDAEMLERMKKIPFPGIAKEVL